MVGTLLPTWIYGRSAFYLFQFILHTSGLNNHNVNYFLLFTFLLLKKPPH